ncbi:MAG TPA: hypothetical protein VFC18_01975 [Burkholderiales bacterium]|nr:hypothetical protein [Burkholderiales bacterium]
MENRRTIRAGPRVIHRHRVGRQVFRRVSELVFVQGQPKALLGWIDIGGVRTPLYVCDLDRAKLRTAKGVRNLYYYDATTIDPRFDGRWEDVSEIAR